MREFFLLLLIVLTLGKAVAQVALQRAMLIKPDDTFQVVFLEGADDTKITYRENERSTLRETKNIETFVAIYQFEPAEFREAMEAFRRYDYEKALGLFEQVRDQYRNFRQLPNNFASRSELWELECLRHLQRFDELKKRRETYRMLGVTYLDEKRQLDMYTFWEALASESWNRLVTLGGEWIEKPLPGAEKAQVAYCYGKGLAELRRTNEALNAFGMAMTANYSMRSALASKAARESLKLLKDDPELLRERQVWGTEDANPGSVGEARLFEAARMVQFYQRVYPHFDPLDDEYTELLKYLPEEDKLAGN